MFANRSTLERKTVAEAVAERLRMRILAGELGEGEQLRQEILASEMGVSRIPLREALRPEQTVIDLVNLEKARRVGAGEYTGICW